MIKEFVQFLKEFNVFSLAVALVMGTAATGLVNSLVKDVFMPLIAPILGAEGWRESVITLGPSTIAIGSFLAELVNFIVLAFIVFFVTKKLFKMSLEAKK